MSTDENATSVTDQVEHGSDDTESVSESNNEDRHQIEMDDDDRKPSATLDQPQNSERKRAGSNLRLQRVQASHRNDEHSNTNADNSSTGNPSSPTAKTGQEQTSGAMSSIRAMAETQPESKKSLHKEILFNLFLGYDEARLEALTKKSGADALGHFLRNQKRPATFPTNPLESSLSKLPLVLSKMAHVGEKQAEENFAENKTRPSYASRTFEKLEEDTMNWYLSKRSHDRKQTKTSCFSLKFNECSIAAISKWSARGRRNQTSKKLSAPKTEFDCMISVPVTDIKFRQCGICKLWGHYEFECPNKTPKHDFDLAMDGIAVDRSKSECTKGANGKEVKQEDEGEPYKTVIEECEGFLIEQSWQSRREYDEKRPRPCPRDKTVHYLEKSNFHGNIIKGGRNLASFNEKDAKFFFEGDMVAWSCADIRKEHINDCLANNLHEDGSNAVHVGIVLDFNKKIDEALVKHLRTILPSSDSVGPDGATSRGENTGAPSWMPSAKLNLVDLAETPVSSCESSRKRGLSSGGIPMSQKYKLKHRMNRDGTLDPVTKPRKLRNGTYAVPIGRHPSRYFL